MKITITAIKKKMMHKSNNVLLVASFQSLYFNVDQILKVQNQNKTTKLLGTFQ